MKNTAWVNTVVFYLVAFAVLMAIAVMCSACNSSTTIIPPGTVYRLAEPVRARVATYDHTDANGVDVYVVQPGTPTIPAGMFISPPPTTRPVVFK